MRQIAETENAEGIDKIEEQASKVDYCKER
jgi:hypothetical protein